MKVETESLISSQKEHQRFKESPETTCPQFSNLNLTELRSEFYV